jgi:mismatch-specific thymine-DNA glycosylase
MGSFKTTINVNGQSHETLMDILPIGNNKLDVLFIAKTPAPKSVAAGHYFQGLQGKMFWNRLTKYNILQVMPNTFEDENLLDHNFGITDIIKVPRSFGNEPSTEEYKAGLNRILKIIKSYSPKIVVFVYKRVLDNILCFGFNLTLKSEYGFNSNLDKYFNSKVFVFPMPGTPCTTEQAAISMNKIRRILKK